MRQSPSRGRASGFTFLELLLVLLLLGIAAAMAFPRLTGVYGGMKAERERSALLRLAEHGRRQARLGGEALSLAWDEREHRFLLRRYDDERDGFGLADAAPASAEQVIDAESWLVWLENDAGLLREFGAPGEMDLSMRAEGDPENGSILAELRIDRATSIDARGLPLRFEVAGGSTGASISLHGEMGDREELVISELGGAAQWLEGGP